MRGNGRPMWTDDRDDDDGPGWDGGPRRGWGGGPRGMMGPGGRFAGPLQEMFDACNGKKPGDDCVVKKDDWELKAKCNVPPRMAAEGRLACTPPHRGPGAPPATEPAKPAGKPKK
jgi:hypothetical protein